MVRGGQAAGRLGQTSASPLALIGRAATSRRQQHHRQHHRQPHRQPRSQLQLQPRP